MAAKKPTQPCLYCGEPFTPARSTAKYCSDACRVGAHRAGIAGLTEEEIDRIMYDAARRNEIAEFQAEAMRVWDEEREAIILRMRTGDVGKYPVDYEELLDRAERKYLKKMHTWEPKAIRARQR